MTGREAEDILIARMWQTKSLRELRIAFEQAHLPPGKKAPSAKYEHEGRSMTISEWTDHLGLKPHTIRQRLKAGFSFADAIKPSGCRTYTVGSETRTIDEWAKHTGISKRTIYNRLSSGLSFEEAVTRKVRTQAAGSKRVESTRRRGVYEHDGQAMTIAEWATYSGAPAETIRFRLRSGLPFAEAIKAERRKPASRARKHTLNGETRTLGEWARRTGIKKGTLYARLEAGLSFEQAVTLPVQETGRHGGRVKTFETTVQTSGGAALNTEPFQAFFLEAAE